MNKWQKISIVLGVLLLLSCFTLAGVGAFWFVSAGGSNVLAAMTGQSPTATPTPSPTMPSAGTLPNQSGGASGNPANRAAGSFGTVQSINGSQITVGMSNGNTRTITLGPQSQVIVAGMPNATASNIEVGDKLLVIGLAQGQSMAARAVIDAPSTYTASNLRIGQVQAVSGQTLTVAARQRTVDVVANSSTQIYGQGLQTLQLASLPIGQSVIIIGEPNSVTGFQAQLIIVENGAAVNGRLPRNGAGQPTPVPTP